MTARLPNVAKNKNQETGKQSKTSLIHRTKFGIGSVLGFGIHFLLMVRLIRNNNGFLKEIRSQAKQVNQWMWLVIEHGCRGYNINTVLVAAAPTFSRTPEDLSAAAGGWDMPSTRFQFVFLIYYTHTYLITGCADLQTTAFRWRRITQSLPDGKKTVLNPGKTT